MGLPRPADPALIGAIEDNRPPSARHVDPDTHVNGPAFPAGPPRSSSKPRRE